MALTDSDTLNARGLLYIVGQNTTPFLSMIGGLNTGRRFGSDKFALSVEGSPTAPGQNVISEDASVTAGTPVTFTKTQATNVTQIMRGEVSVSFKKASQTSKFTGLNNGQEGSAPDGLDYQRMMTLLTMSRDIDYSFIRGTYVDPTSSSVAGQTRGMLAACATNAINASSAALSKALITSSLKSLYNNGAVFQNMVIFAGADQKTKLTDLYGYAPEDRNVGGLNIKQIETDFGTIGVSLEPNMPNNELLFADLSFIAPAFNPITFSPEVGAEIDMASGQDIVFVKTAVSAAAFGGFYYTQVGLDYGPETYHGKITSLAV